GPTPELVSRQRCPSPLDEEHRDTPPGPVRGRPAPLGGRTWSPRSPRAAAAPDGAELAGHPRGLDSVRTGSEVASSPGSLRRRRIRRPGLLEMRLRSSGRKSSLTSRRLTAPQPAHWISETKRPAKTNTHSAY